MVLILQETFLLSACSVRFKIGCNLQGLPREITGMGWVYTDMALFDFKKQLLIDTQQIRSMVLCTDNSAVAEFMYFRGVRRLA